MLKFLVIYLVGYLPVGKLSDNLPFFMSSLYLKST